MVLESYLDAPVPGRANLDGVLNRQAQPIRALVRGTGSIGARHLRVLSALGVNELFAWPVRDQAGNTARPDIPGQTRFVKAYPDNGLDLVVVATDTARHVEDAQEALDNTPRALLLEKPVSSNASMAAPLLEHPGAGSSTVSAPLRFHEGLVALHRVLRHLGGVSSAQVTSQSWLPSWRPDRDYRQSYSARISEGGVLRDLVHDIDYPLFLLGAPQDLFARLGHGVLDIDAEESADLLWNSPASVHVRLDYISKLKTRGIRITAEAGELSWDVVRNAVTLSTVEGAIHRRHFADDASVDVVLARQSLAVIERAGIVAGNTMAAFTPATLDDGVRAVAVCDAARRSDPHGCTEKVLW